MFTFGGFLGDSCAAANHTGTKAQNIRGLLLARGLLFSVGRTPGKSHDRNNRDPFGWRN